ncbi:hypothetical protein R3W88_020215 [Solanum pinnatisectum]|uniref:Uncharacterized protein n=1 Tax=Solanum pinnatisectum TaxID=50273 RepID=A0AAV9KLV9_9SOLN|nr:hypothetical protein R3W88_020215 [Solanum pinnatisectum]
MECCREIQSCLPWKVAVKFRILSKEWRSIWDYHPRIILDEMDLVPTIQNTVLQTKPKVLQTLCNVSEEDTTWTNFIDKFTLLEKLIIADCKLQILHLSQPILASLVLKDCMVKYQVQVDSPKLKSLEFKGDVTNFEGIEDLQELEFVLLYLDPLKLSDYWYINKIDTEAITLAFAFDGCQVVLIPVEVTDMLPVNDIKNLGLEIISQHGTFEEVINDFIWILPDLKTLSLTLGSTTKFIETKLVGVYKIDGVQSLSLIIVTNG